MRFVRHVGSLIVQPDGLHMSVALGNSDLECCPVVLWAIQCHPYDVYTQLYPLSE